MLKQLKAKVRRRRLKKKLKSGLTLISQLNRLMIAEGWTRARRRSFWREFIGEADKVSKLESIERENKNV
jgi:hypothetical protein